METGYFTEENSAEVVAGRIADTTDPRFKANAFENGLICYPTSGTRDGREGDHVLLAPPFIISDDQIGELVDKLDRTLTQTLGT